jgi:DNA-binding LytR/AlgR family response regulator
MWCSHAERERDRHSENGELAVTKEEFEENGSQASMIPSTRDEYTTFAIENNVVDQVLKPSRVARIRRTLNAASRCTAQECTAGSADTLPQRHSTRIAIKANGKILFVDPVEVIVVEAEGNYVSLRHRSESYWLRESISVMAEILKPYGFIRIHRSVLVNSLFVEQIKSRPSGAYGLRTTGGKEYTVTSTYKNNLKSLAAAWIGTDIFLDQ